MRRSLALAVVPVVSASIALSAPGITTSNVNLRAGPSTEFVSLGVLPSGTVLEIVECSVSSVWCEVMVGDEGGFVSGNFISELDLPPAASAAADVSGPGPDAAFDDDLFTDEELDTLVGPVALFPDDLVAQILIAATAPLDVIRADRWVTSNGELAPGDRAAAAAAEGWDESVAVLAAGFPTVVTRMAEDIDWTELLGDAVVLQHEDVLDAIQRQRARARALGNLDTNEAQRVEVTNNVIVIEPAQPEVVFVPRYDPDRVFVERAPAPPVIVQQGGLDAGAVIATGAVAFVTAYALGSVFDDRWRRSYWWGPPRVNWTNNNFYPRPGWRPGVRPDRPDLSDRPWRPDRPDRPGAGRPERPEIGRPGRPERPGSRPDREAERPWRPDDRRRDEARERVRNERASRERPGAGRPGAERPGRPGRPGRPERPAAGDRSRTDRAAIERRLRDGEGRPTTRPGAGAQRPSSPPAANRPGGRNPVATDRTERARDAANRGRGSAGGARAPQQRVSRPAERNAARPSTPQRAAPARPQRPAQAQRPAQRQAQRPAQRQAQRPAQRQAQRPSGGQRQAQQRRHDTGMQRNRGGAREATAHRSRGNASRGGNRRGR